eukprot:gene8821-18257_t
MELDKVKLCQAQNLFRECSLVFPSVQPITTAEIQALDKNGIVVLVDVRSSAEQRISTIPNSIAKETFESKILPNCDKNSLIIPYCTIGYRSGKYGLFLQEKGFKNVRNGEGVVLWTHSGKPLVKTRGNQDVFVFECHTFGKKWDLAATSYKTVQFTQLHFIIEGLLFGVSDL